MAVIAILRIVCMNMYSMNEMKPLNWHRFVSFSVGTGSLNLGVGAVSRDDIEDNRIIAPIIIGIKIGLS